MTIVSYVVEIGVCTPCHFVNAIVNLENEIFAVRKEKTICSVSVTHSWSDHCHHCHHIVIILIFFSNSIVMVVMGHLRAENTYFPTSPRPAPNLYPTPSFLERNLHHLHLHRCKRPKDQDKKRGLESQRTIDEKM